jgi:hypothetical protein
MRKIDFNVIEFPRQIQSKETSRSKVLIETRIFDFSSPSPINKNLFSYRFLLHCERSRKMFLNAMETDPFKLINGEGVTKSNLRVKNSPLK